jgi:glucose/arabinose dehydrogenase/cytochrome c2
VAAALAAQPAAAADRRRGQELYREQCALCHGAAGEGSQGPPLTGVMGRKAGAVSGFAYTPAMREAGAKGLTWKRATLERFLAGPDSVVPGTSMQLVVPAASDRADLVAFLGRLETKAPAKTSAMQAKPGASTPPRQSASAAPAAPSSAAAAPSAPAAPSPAAVAAAAVAAAAAERRVLTGAAAFGDWRSDAPGLWRRITADALPAPHATRSAQAAPAVVSRPPDAVLHVPPGFAVKQFADGLDRPRILRVAPNGDLFVSELSAGRVRVLRAADGAAKPERVATFASGLTLPHGLAFYPPGAAPRWLYVAETNRVVRFKYAVGDLQAQGPPEVVVQELSPHGGGGHITRDVAFSPDGKVMFVAVGSASNVAEGLPRKSAEEVRRWEAAHGLGAAWGFEERRAAVLAFDPEGRFRRIFATGLRNCVGIAVHPRTGDLWCSLNERDGLGDDLVPDFITRVKPGAFYGWPWYYVGDHEDPRHAGERKDLAGKVTVPDVLVEAHSASLQVTFYDARSGSAAFPAEYRDDGFAALHGSWNRSSRTGYKIVRVRAPGGVPTGEYQDFVTGFVVDADSVWGRPVGVAVAHDGALLFTDDAQGTIWRVSYGKGRAP